jgi:hypothetical protein
MPPDALFYFRFSSAIREASLLDLVQEEAQRNGYRVVQRSEQLPDGTSPYFVLYLENRDESSITLTPDPFHECYSVVIVTRGRTPETRQLESALRAALSEQYGQELEWVADRSRCPRRVK